RRRLTQNGVHFTPSRLRIHSGRSIRRQKDRRCKRRFLLDELKNLEPLHATGSAQPEVSDYGCIRRSSRQTLRPLDVPSAIDLVPLCRQKIVYGKKDGLLIVDNEYTEPLHVADSSEQNCLRHIIAPLP